MEFFNDAEAVRLRSHLDKYLVANDDQETVRQSRNGSTRNAKWQVELIEGKNHVIRLKSCHGKYLSASDIPFLLGMTGKKVLQALPETKSDLKIQWEPIRDGFEVRFRTWCGKYLRANGGTPPWRNSVTQDNPETGSTKNWILWNVEAVEITESESISDYISSLSSNSDFSGSEPGSPTLRNPRLSLISKMSFNLSPKQSPRAISPLNSNKFRCGMELFQGVKTVRLKSHHGKYLIANEDGESVSQDRHGSAKNARWKVELASESDSLIRLKSCYNKKYLTASNDPFLLGMTGRKVTQSLPRQLDSSVEWEPIREGVQVKLRTRYGQFLRANGGLPPWRNSVTHDVPHRTVTQDWVLWDVDIVESEAIKSPRVKQPDVSVQSFAHSDSTASETDSTDLLFSVPFKWDAFSRQEYTDSAESPSKSDGRTVYYHIADENGCVEGEELEEYTMYFKGSGVEALTRKLEEVTGMQDIVVCTRSPLDGKLHPLHLQLPPNNAAVNVVVVQSSTKVAKDFANTL